MSEFKAGRSPILIATDVASRGLGTSSYYRALLRWCSCICVTKLIAVLARGVVLWVHLLGISSSVFPGVRLGRWEPAHSTDFLRASIRNRTGSITIKELVFWNWGRLPDLSQSGPFSLSSWSVNRSLPSLPTKSSSVVSWFASQRSRFFGEPSITDSRSKVPKSMPVFERAHQPVFILDSSILIYLLIMVSSSFHLVIWVLRIPFCRKPFVSNLAFAYVSFLLCSCSAWFLFVGDSLLLHIAIAHANRCQGCWLCHCKFFLRLLYIIHWSSFVCRTMISRTIAKIISIALAALE